MYGGHHVLDFLLALIGILRVIMENIHCYSLSKLIHFITLTMHYLLDSSAVQPPGIDVCFLRRTHRNIQLPKYQLTTMNSKAPTIPTPI